jgi:S-layer homology domain
MNKLGVSLPVTSVILGYNLLILYPVWAQANSTDIPASETQTITKLQQNNQRIFENYFVSPLADEKIEVSKSLSSSQKGLEIGSTVNFKPGQTASKANPQFQLYSQSRHPSDELNNEVIDVEQLRDVSPGDWAYEALRNLVDKYRCITASGNGTFDGNRAMTRYEFADTLNNCLQKVGRKIYSLSNKFSTQE